MRSRFSPRLFILGLVVAGLLAVIVHWLTPAVPFWGAFVIAYGAMLVNGLVATWEDNKPGGFNHPKE